MIKLDDKDREIIRLISTNPRLTQKQLAEILGITQPAVSMRLSKLKAMGLLDIQVGIDPGKAKLVLAKVDIKAKDASFLFELSKCPYVIYGATSTGSHNVCLLMVGEDYRTLEAVINKHIRGFKNVEDLEFNIILDIHGKLIVPFKSVDESEELPDCVKRLLAMDGCKNCSYYQRGLCMGCPLTSDYRGTLFKFKP